MSTSRQHLDSDWYQWKQRWGASVFAGAFSVLLHAAALAALCFIGLSHSRSDRPARAIPSADISAVSRLINQVLVTSAPKIKRPGPAGTVAAAAPVEKVFPRRIFNDLPSPAAAGQDNTGFKWPREIKLGQQVRFFGLSAGERRVCYVIDATASIAPMFDRVRTELKDSITALEPDQFFSVVFYGSGGLRVFGGPAMVRANIDRTTSAAGFVSLINPAGTGDALAALERAKEICSATPEGTRVIYFLTDSLKLDAPTAKSFDESVEKMLLDLGPGTRINTIAFRPGDVDRQLLKQIAQSTGGLYLCPAELDSPAPGVIDLTDIDFLEGTAVKDE